MPVNAFALLLALGSQNALLPIQTGWYVVSLDAEVVAMADRGSVSGPVTDRRIKVITIAKAAQDGVKSVEMVMAVDCVHRRQRYISMDRYSTYGRALGPSNYASSPMRAIEPATIGYSVAEMACEKKSSGFSDHGTPIMLQPAKAADHAFRLIGIGLSVEIAAAIAGLDAEKAPTEFEKMLNALVPTDQHLYVRAIKTPNARLP